MVYDIPYDIYDVKQYSLGSLVYAHSLRINTSTSAFCSIKERCTKRPAVRTVHSAVKGLRHCRPMVPHGLGTPTIKLYQSSGIVWDRVQGHHKIWDWQPGVLLGCMAKLLRCEQLSSQQLEQHYCFGQA